MPTYTTEDRKNMVDAFALFLDRKYDQIEQRYKSGEWKPFNGPFIVYPDGEWTYRPKPSPSVIPWTRETCPPLPFEVVSKETGNRYAVTVANKIEVYIPGLGGRKYQELYDWYTRPDGSPCGEVSK